MIKSNSIRSSLLYAAVGTMGFMPSLALAQGDTQAAEGAAQTDDSANPAGLEEIIVTAERKSASVQSTPISISAIGGDALAANHVVNIEGMTESLANVQFARNTGDAKIFIRGVGYDSVAPGGETRVAVYSDGAYLPRSQSVLLGMFDVNRVEVLRGPQGTLYGRNATAGAINILTNDPTRELSGYATLGVGNYGLIRTEGAVSGTIAGDLRGRLAFQTLDQSGYGKNIDTGEDVDDGHIRSIRGTLMQDVGNVTVRIEGDYSWEKDHRYGRRFVGRGNPAVTPLPFAFGYVAPSDPRDAAGLGPQNRIETYGTTAQLTWKLSDDIQLVSVSALRHLTASLDTNIDQTTSGFSRQFLRERSTSASEELRLQATLGIVDFILGGYYFHEKNYAQNTIPLAGVALGIPGNQALFQGSDARGTVRTNAFAGFARATIHATDRLGLDVGIRYSDEKKSINETNQFDFRRLYDPSNPLIPRSSANRSSRWTSVDPTATLHYQFPNNIFAYATFSQGFKSGGFNIGSVQPPFAPEKLRNYEVGLKADLFDRKLRANIAAFHYDYTNLQVNIARGTLLLTENASSATIDGGELELTALPVRDLTLSANFSYLDGRYKDFISVDPSRAALGPLNLDGNQLTYAPKYKASGRAEYIVHAAVGDFVPWMEVNYTSRVQFSQFNLPNVSQAAYTLVNLGVRFERPDSGFSIAGYVRNLTNKDYYSGQQIGTSVLGLINTGQLGAPRTFGVDITKRF
ncbi:TonB-dependent receptor [Sphingobium phenoxybenzoativorans]|uniref:TonB-dependent receptor n=1 Tax=Sphingobium phenoxybenzoativorans TaxID=1592790 RepID=A0A975KC12_9SPHN|nr:TonB-dependent receptor [Sphingobium phenoxybenzoativorans]QUT07267.1 TonB-dependent receptor [Sphingobium phenoxybenzoativorans]